MYVIHNYLKVFLVAAGCCCKLYAPANLNFTLLTSKLRQLIFDLGNNDGVCSLRRQDSTFESSNKSYNTVLDLMSIYSRHFLPCLLCFYKWAKVRVLFLYNIVFPNERCVLCTAHYLTSHVSR